MTENITNNLENDEQNNLLEVSIDSNNVEPITKETKILDNDIQQEIDEDFNWDAVGKAKNFYSKEEKAKLDELYEKSFSNVVENDVVFGTIVIKNNKEVVVNIGYKSDGIIPLSELRYNPDIKVGDKIEVFVESQEDTNGQLILSHKKAKIIHSWKKINDVFLSGEVIKGTVKCRTKGGLIVDVYGLEAFLPGSQIDVKPIRDYDVYVDTVMDLKVVKINQEFKNVVVSHKALIEAEIEQQKAEIISKLEKGQILEGIVKNITNYGVFVDLGGIDGLIHITDLTWGRVSHPEEIVQLDQKINVVILDFDDEKKRIALGIKQLTQHPWDALDADLKVGDKVKGKVVVLADYGAFIEIAPGVEGLIHVSEMSWSQHFRTAYDYFKIGDEIESVILTLDRDERKISLGIKQLSPDPWTNITEKYIVGSRYKSTVRNFTTFGVFVELEPGVDGLIHISDLSWSKKIKHPSEFTQVGATLEVEVLEVDNENRRLSLGHKQLEENPWDAFESVFTVNSIHKGTVIEITDKGAVVLLPYGLEGFAFSRHLLKSNNKQAKVNETLEFKVLEFNKDNCRIFISHSQIWQEEEEDKRSAEREKRRKERKDQPSTHVSQSEKQTFGDIEALANLKSNMDKEERSKKKAKKDAEIINEEIQEIKSEINSPVATEESVIEASIEVQPTVEISEVKPIESEAIIENEITAEKEIATEETKIEEDKDNTIV